MADGSGGLRAVSGFILAGGDRYSRIPREPEPAGRFDGSES